MTVAPIISSIVVLTKACHSSMVKLFCEELRCCHRRHTLHFPQMPSFNRLHVHAATGQLSFDEQCGSWSKPNRPELIERVGHGPGLGNPRGNLGRQREEFRSVPANRHHGRLLRLDLQLAERFSAKAW